MEEKRFEIVAPGKQVFLVPVLASVAVMVGIGVMLMNRQGTPIPAGAHVLFAFVPVMAALLALDMLFRDVRLNDRGLRVRALPWPRTIPLDAFDLERAEIADLGSRPELMPRYKIAGSRLPGFRAGSFWLRDKRRALVLLTELRRVLVLPRRDGTVVLLSLQRPEALLDALRRRG